MDGKLTGLRRAVGERPCSLREGLTLLEMLVATTLLVVIVLGLTAMFVQTQKAFRGGFTQSDVLESGRTVIDMMSRDFEQMADAQDPNITNFFYHRFGPPLVQYETNGNFSRVNYLSDAFTLQHINSTWYGIGYAISNAVSGGASSPQSLVGTLYKFTYQTNDIPRDNPCFLFANFGNTQNYDTNYFNRIIDGVVHFRIRAFDVYGRELTNHESAFQPEWFGDLWLPDTVPGDKRDYGLTNNLPGSVELELGILEPQTIEQIRAMGTNVVAQSNYLSSRMSAVHIFRQQIPIRTALPR